jgi:hypothetical protein
MFIERLKLRHSLLFSVTILSIWASAQSSLEILLTRTIVTSPEAKVLELSQSQIAFQDKLQSAPLKPSLSLTSNLPGFTRSINSITQPDGSLKFQTQSQAFSSFGINASQALPFSGGRLSLTSGLNRIDLFDPNTSTAWSSNLFVVSYSQPLFQFNELKYLKPNLNVSQGLNEALYSKQKRQFEQKIAALVLDYYNATRQKKYLKKQLLSINKTVQKTQYLVQAGKILKEDLDLLNIEQKQTQNQLENLEFSLASLKEQLSYHLGDSSFEDEIIDFNINSWPRFVPSKDSLVELAQRDPSWLENIQAIEQAEQNIERQKQNSGLSASFDVSFGFNQRADELQGIYKNPLDRQMATVSVSMPILDGGRSKYNQLIAQNGLEQASLQKQIAEQSIEQRINDVISQFKQLDEQISLSEESLALARNRSKRYSDLFEVGKITVDQYLDAQNYANRIELELLSAQVNYWKLWYSVLF